MSSPSDSELASHHKHLSENVESSAGDNKSAPRAGDTPTPTLCSASGTRDPQSALMPPSELTTTAPQEPSLVTNAQKYKGVKFAPHITLISERGNGRKVPWNSFPSQTSLVAPERPLGLYRLTEFLKDLGNLPLHFTNQHSKPGLCQQPSQLSLRRILAQVRPKNISTEGLSPGLQRPVSKRFVAKVRSLVSPKYQKTTGSSTNQITIEASVEEAETSISLGLDGSYLIHAPSSHRTLTLTTNKPLSPLPTKISWFATQPTSSSQPRAGGRSHGTTIPRSYEIMASHLPRVRTSSTQTIKAGESSTATGSMTSSADDTASAQRIPLVCPAWDRRVDISWARSGELSWDGARELGAFRVSLAQFHRESRHTPTANDHFNPLLRLPDRIRYMIAKYLVPDDADMLPIKLNNGAALYEPVWPAAYFARLADVLHAVRDYTSVCWAMRADILVTILNTRRFHVVLSPFSTPTFDPLARRWFVKYAGYIQHLTIELDFSKLGFAAAPAAANLRPLVSGMAAAMDEYANAQRKRSIQQEILLNTAEVFFSRPDAQNALRGDARRGRDTVHSLTLAARRYFGDRPAEAGRAPQNYSPDEYLAVLGPVKALCGKVGHLRAVGLDADSTHRLLALVWEGMTAESVQRAVAARLGTVRATRPSDFYPTLPGQASVFDDGAGGDHFVRHPFAFDGGRVGFYVDESQAAAAARRGRAHSRILLGEPVSKGGKGLPGLASSGRRGDGMETAVTKTAVTEKEKAPEWPEEPEETEEKSGGSSTETEPFPELPDVGLQLALLAAYQASEAVKASVERFPSPERQQGEAEEEQMPVRIVSSSGRVLGRVAGRLQRTISQLALQDKDKTSKE